jgi:hypothetical protein
LAPVQQASEACAWLKNIATPAKSSPARAALSVEELQAKVKVDV